VFAEDRAEWGKRTHVAHEQGYRFSAANFAKFPGAVCEIS